MAFGVGFGVGIGTSQFARDPERLEAGVGVAFPTPARVPSQEFAAAPPQRSADAAPDDPATVRPPSPEEVEEAAITAGEPVVAADPAADLHLAMTGPVDTPIPARASATPPSATAEAMNLRQPVPRVVTPLPRPLLDGLTRNAELAPEARPAKGALDRGWDTEQVTVQRGDTLTDILSRAGIDQAEAHAAVRSLQ
jgi:hypothetical protein